MYCCKKASGKQELVQTVLPGTGCQSTHKKPKWLMVVQIAATNSTRTL